MSKSGKTDTERLVAIEYRLVTIESVLKTDLRDAAGQAREKLQTKAQRYRKCIPSPRSQRIHGNGRTAQGSALEPLTNASERHQARGKTIIELTTTLPATRATLRR